MNKKNKPAREHTYYVNGMHCPSCEVLIEKTILKEKQIESAEASTNDSAVHVTYRGSRPAATKLNKIFSDQEYTFSDQKLPPQKNNSASYSLKNIKVKNLLRVSGITMLIIALYLAFNKLGGAALLSVNSQSSLPAFFVFGLLAGFSTCSALVGGIILSMSKQWARSYDKTDSAIKKLKPHFMFNFGRIISFALTGSLLGLIGKQIQVSPTFTALLTIGISLLMLILGLQMLGVKKLQGFRLNLPRKITRFVVNENNFQTYWMPLLIGSLSFLLPCGFTLTSQSLALVSGNPLQGGLIMATFALGTLPSLLLIGLSSVKLVARPHLGKQFLTIAGILVVFFAVYNFNSQLNVLGLSSLSDLRIFAQQKDLESEDLPPIINGKQVIKMSAQSYTYDPAYFRVRSGIPVRWEIANDGVSGCTNAIISKGLFEGQIDLQSQKVAVKTFTPQEPGKYKFSCWMGMVSGVIEVIDANNGPTPETEPVIESGASGCSGSSSCGGSCGGTCGNPQCQY